MKNIIVGEERKIETRHYPSPHFCGLHCIRAECINRKFLALPLMMRRGLADAVCIESDEYISFIYFLMILKRLHSAARRGRVQGGRCQRGVERRGPGRVLVQLEHGQPQRGRRAQRRAQRHHRQPCTNQRRVQVRTNHSSPAPAFIIAQLLNPPAL